MMRQAKPVKPRRLGNKKPAPHTVINVKGRAARHLAPTLGVKENVPGQPTAFQHRYLTGPVVWGLVVTVAGVALRVTHRPVVFDVLFGFVFGVLILLGTRHLSRAARRWSEVAALCTGLWLPLIAALGPRFLVIYLFCWAGLFGRWLWLHRIRQQEQPAGPTSDELTWQALAEHKRWHGRLGKPEQIPNGVRYPLRLDGIHTHIGKVLAEPVAIAAAWHKPITEAYVEPAPDGVASRGSLTILRTGTLQQIRYWDGQGVTPDGFATIGRFADGADARIRLFAPMDGARHSLIAGTTGAGKSELLNLLLHMYLTSGFIYPIVLDPQEGQSLPDWQGHVPYAAGLDECMEMLELLHQLMYSRSRRLSQMTYDAGEGHIRRMSFFDHTLTGWPYVRAIIDEAHVLLTGHKLADLAVAWFKDMGKLGRKTGTGEDLVTQVPSLEELVSNVLRSMLRGGNVIGLRTADRVSGGMMGLPADPHDIPQYFPNGDFTYGLGYVLGPDRRQAIARTDITSAEQRRITYQLPVLDAESQAILDRFGTGVPLLQRMAAPVLAAVPMDDSPAPGGQTATDAIFAVLTHEMSRDELLEAVARQAVAWGRAKPWTVRAVTGPLKTLADDGRIAKTDRGMYAPAARPVLTLAD